MEYKERANPPNRGRGHNSDRGRGGRGRGNDYQPNYKQQNMDTLMELFGKQLDRDSIWEVFRSNSFDMDKTITQLSTLTGIQVNTETQQNEDTTSYKCTIEEKKGDLFSTSESDSLAHCVSRDLRMGKGIAVAFKEKFGEVDNLVRQNRKIGEAAILGPYDQNRYIYYLITKENYWNKPTYDTLRDTLLTMRDHMDAHGVKSLSIPRLGCGLDGLLWGQVKQLIKKVFADRDVRITVYSL